MRSFAPAAMALHKPGLLLALAGMSVLRASAAARTPRAVPLEHAEATPAMSTEDGCRAGAGQPPRPCVLSLLWLGAGFGLALTAPVAALFAPADWFTVVLAPIEPAARMVSDERSPARPTAQSDRQGAMVPTAACRNMN